MIKFNNAHFWRSLKNGDAVAFLSNEPQSVLLQVKATVPVVVTMRSASADGELAEFRHFVAYCQPGENSVRIAHGMGFVLEFEFKGGIVSVYDDREEHQVVAPVGETFTRFEKLGNRQIDPVQIIMHRDAVRRRLEAQVERDSGRPNQLAEMQGQIERLSQMISEMERARNRVGVEAAEPDQGDEQDSVE